MVLPSLPQDDTPAQQAERRAQLAEAQSRYTWAHSHTYPDGQVIAPIAVLQVDDAHPLPDSQNFDLVQFLDLINLYIELGTNVLVNLTNLLGVGRVRLDSAQPSAAAVEAELEQLRAKLQGYVEDAQALRSAAHERAQAGVLESALLTKLGQLGKQLLDTLLDDALAGLLSKAGLWGPASSPSDYSRQFQTIPVPVHAAAVMSDEAFAWMRVAGPNPLLIQAIDALPSNFPVDAARCLASTGAALDAALTEGRAFLVDYAALSSLEAGSSGAGPKYSCAPLALFVLDGARLRPAAIQCGQEPGNSTPVIYPDEGPSWELAKLHLQSADGNYHELISHLGLTHLLIEPFAVSTQRNLAQQHPLYRLLLPHFQGTLFINNQALVSLIAPGGTVDRLLAGTIASDWGITASALEQLNFNDHMLVHELEARGVAEPSKLPQYPYRDDALLVWQAIEAWVRAYLALYYNDDDAVSADTELQAWYQDIVSPEGGCVQGFGEPCPDGSVGLCSFDYLVEAVTMVVFTSSAQHATVNFPQRDIMSYTPAMPLALYQPPPTELSASQASQLMLATLPPLQMTLLQQLLGQLLGGLYFTRLGDYDRHAREPWFQDPRVLGPLSAFQAKLAEVEREIGLRNFERPLYQTLLPSRIPQSINI